jgi:hypothetical protein
VAKKPEALGSGHQVGLRLGFGSQAEWAETANGRKAKVYSLTAAGKKALAEQREEWAAFSGALAAILKVS